MGAVLRASLLVARDILLDVLYGAGLVRKSTLPCTAEDLFALLRTQGVVPTNARLDVLASWSQTTSRLRFKVDNQRAYFAKMTPDSLLLRVFAVTFGLERGEAIFFQNLATKVPINVPKFLYVDSDGVRGVVVLEDLTDTGAEFFSVTKPFQGMRRVEALVDALADLHAKFWGAHRGQYRPIDSSHIRPDLDSLAGPMWTAAVKKSKKLAPHLFGDDGIEQLILLNSSKPRDIYNAIQRPPLTLVHGDPHPGNIYFKGDEVGFFDWQVFHEGHGMRDVVYALVLSQESEWLAQHERALVERYRRRLIDRGVGTEYSDAEAWTRYCECAWFPANAAIITLGLSEGQMQSLEICVTSATRSLEAIKRLDTYQLVKARLAQLQR